MTEKKSKTSLPQLDWKHATCQVCGKTVDYISKRAPKTCNGGDCEYKFQYNIEPTSWAGYQPTFFDKS